MEKGESGAWYWTTHNKALLTIVLIIFFLLLLRFFGFFEQLDFDPELSDSGEEIVDFFESSTILHWTHMPLAYRISEDCNEFQARRVEWGFETIEAATDNIVRFTPRNHKPDISVNCFFESTGTGPEYQAGNISATADRIKILRANINFYNVDKLGTRHSGGCAEYPDVEVRETLRVFGFDYSDDPTSIMNFLSRKCTVRDIDSEIINVLKDTYS